MNNSGDCNGFNNNIGIVSQDNIVESIEFTGPVNEKFIPDANYTLTGTSYTCDDYTITFDETTFHPSEMVGLITLYVLYLYMPNILIIISCLATNLYEY